MILPNAPALGQPPSAANLDPVPTFDELAAEGDDYAAAAAELDALTAPRDPPDPDDLAHERNRLARLEADAERTRRAIAASARRLGGPAWADYFDAMQLTAEDAARPPVFPIPEDRGTASLSELGGVEYVEDIIRPGRIVAVAAEEGAGKSYAIPGELGIRMAAAGGSFAGSWPVLRTGPVLYLSEMHADDDYAREETILASLELDRTALAGRYYRLPLQAAAGGKPALTVPEWRAWATAWLRDRGALLLIVDTATGATQVDPWGRAIQEVYAALRVMLGEYPELAIVLLIHLKKPQGRGDRRISDVLGEWGRWCDVVMLLEADGTSRTKVSVRKRVRRERRIVVTKRAGLLVDPEDLDEARGAKVPPDAVLAAIEAAPGLTYAELGAALGVSKDTAARYVAALGGRVDAIKGTARSGRGASMRLYAIAASPHVAAQEGCGDGAATAEAEEAAPRVGSPHRRSTYIGAAIPRAAMPAESPGPAVTVQCADYGGHQSHHYQSGGAWRCRRCSPQESAT